MIGESAPQNSDLTTFTLKVEGQPLPDTYRISSIDISREFGRIASASIVLLDGDSSKQTFEVSSEEHLVPGKSIEIFGGYSSDENLMFKGTIVTQNIKMRKPGESYLYVECRDAAYRMTLARRSRYFKDVSYSEMFEEIAAGYPEVNIETKPTTEKHPEKVQFRISDWDFLVAQAENAGLHCLTLDGKIKIFKPDEIPEPALNLSYGVNVFDLDLEMDSRLQFSEVKASSWDASQQQLLDADIDDVTTPSQGNIPATELAQTHGDLIFELKHSGRLSQQELDGWVEAQMIKTRFSKIRGTLNTQGTDKVLPGELVELEGLGDRFNGKALVSGVRHSLSQGDWITSLQVGTHPDWHHQRFHIQDKPASGLHPGIAGLHIGKVTDLEDPDGENRILVRLPTIHLDGEGVWSRLATLDAGENRGTVFRPEIDDEVIVGFVDGDPNQPVVLGMLHSSQHPAPFEAANDNHEKGWVTRSEMKITFNDDEVSLTIETPNGNKILMSDQDGGIVLTDENDNSLTMNSEGITLESPKKISVKATDDLALEGKNVKGKADMSATLEGGSEANLKSGGTTNVQGATVKIN